MNVGLGNGCSPTLMMYMLLVGLVLTGLCSCRSMKYTQTSNESHKVSELFDRMDSLFRSTSAWQQDMFSKQSSLIDSFSHNEKRDTSHTVVVNEKGDTVRERIVVFHEIEKDHSSEKEVSEMWMHRFEKVDSMLRVAIDRQEKTDSLLREHEKVTEKQLTKWEQIRLDYGGYALIMLIILLFIVFCWFIKKFAPRWQQQK